eukprot:TRINITY_DN7194_c0_g1_i1.p1 TRINITY_DN7194_c0_g1~~TRINITY_DN7194_c0_g1_i1.p1  ORF type:complete len:417 (-),score=140.35 TRINITY_DN7194_c0_g1_i1:98-1348(-)
MKDSVVLIFALIGLASAQFNLHLLSNYSGAVCLDGTPGGYYFKPGSGADANNWVIWFQGGGWCYEEADCWQRSKTALGSSKSWAQTTTCIGGALSCSCSDNPLFCNYNMVLLQYCDGNSFSGNRAEPIVYNGDQIYFRGHSVLEAVLQDLATLPNWNQANKVLLSGCSAGGLSTFLHADFVGTQLPASVQRYGAMPESGFFLLHDSVENVPVYPNEMQYIFTLSNATAGVNPNCIAAVTNVSNQWTCNFAEMSYAYTKVPFFPLNSLYDLWQLICILTPVPVAHNSTANGDCNAIPAWKACINKLEDCTADQVAVYNQYAQSFISKMTSSGTSKSNGQGGYISSCIGHCESLNDAAWNALKIGGVSMQQAVQNWWLGPSDAPAADNWHWDCTYNARRPYACNPTCWTHEGKNMMLA